MRPLHIAYVADMVTAHAGGGGIVAGRQFVDLLREEHRVTVIGTEPYGDDSITLPAFDFPIPAMKATHFVMAQPLRSVLARAFADVDVVHLQFPFWLSRVALQEAQRARRPAVAAFHVQPENALSNVGIHARWLNELIYRDLIGHLYNRASGVICPTQFAERKLRERGLHAPTFVISNGVPPDMVPTEAHRDPAYDGFFLVVMVGRLAAEKRQEVLIEAVRASRYADRIKLVIAGAGSREKALRKLARGLPNEVEFGFVPRDRLRHLLASADLFVHCSEVELEGISVLEAMSMGLPALVAEGPETAASEIALGPAFRFPAGDVAALANKLDGFVEHPDLLANARPFCRAAAARRSIGDSIRDLVGVYRHVIELESSRSVAR